MINYFAARIPNKKEKKLSKLEKVKIELIEEQIKYLEWFLTSAGKMDKIRERAILYRISKLFNEIQMIKELKGGKK